MQPAGDGFVRGVAAVAIVIAGTDEEFRLLSEQPEVFFDDRDLHIRIERGAEIEQVTADGGHVEPSRLIEQPVELFQRVMQVGDKKQAHAGLGSTRWLSRPRAKRAGTLARVPKPAHLRARWFSVRRRRPDWLRIALDPFLVHVRTSHPLCHFVLIAGPPGSIPCAGS